MVGAPLAQPGGSSFSHSLTLRRGHQHTHGVRGGHLHGDPAGQWTLRPIRLSGVAWLRGVGDGLTGQPAHVRSGDVFGEVCADPARFYRYRASKSI